MSIEARLHEIHGDYIASATLARHRVEEGEVYPFIGAATNGQEIHIARHNPGEEFVSVYRFLQDDLPPKEANDLTALEALCVPHSLVAYLRSGESHSTFYVDENGDRYRLVFEFIANQIEGPQDLRNDKLN